MDFLILIFTFIKEHVHLFHEILQQINAIQIMKLLKVDSQNNVIMIITALVFMEDQEQEDVFVSQIH